MTLPPDSGDAASPRDIRHGDGCRGQPAEGIMVIAVPFLTKLGDVRQDVGDRDGPLREAR